MKIRRNSHDAKQFILDVAEDLLIAEGAAGLKISHIAKNAGMHHPNIAHHFGSIAGVRTALMNRLIGRYVAEVMDIIRDVNDTKSYDSATTVNRVIKRIFKMYSEPYMPALLGWKLSDSRGQPVHEIEMMVENFIQLTSEKMTELGHVDKAKRSNILEIVHMVLSVCIGNMFLKSMWSKSLVSDAVDEALQTWVINSVTQLTTEETQRIR